MTSFVTDLGRGLRARSKAAPDKDIRPSTPQRFLEQDIVAETGPWTLKGHEAFAGILLVVDEAIRGSERNAGTSIAILAGEQVGKTLVALGTALHLVADRAANVGYFLPTDKFAHKFGRTRLKKIIANSPYLRGQMKDHEAVNQATLKEFNGHHLYVLGLESMLGAISIPMDALVYDEVDLLPAENLEWSQGRVAHSKLRFEMFVSAGYTPGAGIDKRYQEGTQHRYLVPCPNRRCDLGPICLEDVFPACMAKVKGKWERVCPECGSVLDLAKGAWVALHPERAKKKLFSFRLSSLVIGAREADHIMKRWERAKKRKSEKAKFDCAERAMPNAGALQPVTDAEIEKMKRRYVMQLATSGRPRYAGMDLGDICHFKCYERDETGRRRVVWLEEIDSDVAVERVSTLIGSLGVVSMVIDKKPLTTVARALAFRFPRIVKLQDFTTNWTLTVVDEEHQGRKYQCVKVDRDESLDEYTSEITSDGIDGLLLPDADYVPDAQTEALKTWAEHHKNLRKERTVTEKAVVDKYKRDVPNHFGMAGNSARLAELVAPKYSKFEFYAVDDDDDFDDFDERPMRSRIT